MTEYVPDPIHPDYYCRAGIKVYEIIDAYDLGFYKGNALAYIMRAGSKDDAVQDLLKAIWNIQREIDKLERSNEK